MAKKAEYEAKKENLDKKLEEMKLLSAQVDQNPNNTELYQKLMNLINNDIANLTDETASFGMGFSTKATASFGMGLNGEGAEHSSDTGQ